MQEIGAGRPGPGELGGLPAGPALVTPSAQQPSFSDRTVSDKRDTREGGAAFPPRPDVRGLHAATLMSEDPTRPIRPGEYGPPGGYGSSRDSGPPGKYADGHGPDGGPGAGQGQGPGHGPGQGYGQGQGTDRGYGPGYGQDAGYGQG